MSIRRVAILVLGVSMVSSTASARAETTTTAPTIGDLTGTVLVGRYEGAVEQYVTMTPEDAQQTEIFQAEGCAPCVVLSPDGTQVSTPAFTDDGLTTAIVSVDGGDRRVLPLPGIAGAWSPDSRSLAVGVWVQGASSKTGIYTARAADGSGLWQVTTSGHEEFHEPFAWSPDGRRILFFVERGPIGSVTHAGDLFVVGTDGSGMRRLNPAGVSVGRVTAAGAPASWSPDGRSVMFAAFDRGTEGDRSAVFVVAAADGRARRITDWGSMIASAAWSPTEDLIAFSEIAGPVSLVTPGGELRTLSTRGRDSCRPVWSPDGSHLLVRRMSGPLSVLAIVDLQGNMVATVTRRPGRYFGHAWEG